MADVFRISIIKWAIDTGVAFLQAFGHGDPDDADNQELCQEDSLDHIQHYGFVSRPPVGVDTEGIVVESDGGDACIAERYNLENLATHGGADALPTINDGDTVLYAKDGTYIFLDADGNLTIYGITGNVDIKTKSGQVKLGRGGATYRDQAYAHTTEAGASKVACGLELNSWTGDVCGDVAAIKADLTNIATVINQIVTQANVVIGWSNIFPIAGPSGALALTPIAGVPSVVPLTSDAIPVDTDHSYVSTGSKKAEVEP